MSLSQLNDHIEVHENTMDFMGYKTYYRIAGDITSGKAPLITLHGGPGSTHNYMELLDPVALCGRAVISYDQLGCGKSYVENRPDLWKLSTWENELDALISHLGLSKYYLLGQSWGGMLAQSFALDCNAQGLQGLILSSTLPSSQLWAREQHRLARMLPALEHSALMNAEKTQDFSGRAYTQALDHFMTMHCCDLTYDETAPECLRRPKKSGEESYVVAWGPNELTATGTLADWNVIDRLHHIKVPTLIISGTDDECTPLIAKTMFDRIPNARWELFEGCRHMCYADNNEHYLSVICDFMTN